MRNATIRTLAGVAVISAPVLVSLGLPEQTSPILKAAVLLIITLAFATLVVLPVMAEMLYSSDEAVQARRKKVEAWVCKREKAAHLQEAKATKLLRKQQYEVARERVEQMRTKQLIN